MQITLLGLKKIFNRRKNAKNSQLFTAKATYAEAKQKQSIPKTHRRCFSCTMKTQSFPLGSLRHRG